MMGSTMQPIWLPASMRSGVAPGWRVVTAVILDPASLGLEWFKKLREGRLALFEEGARNEP